jgi:hypothetical protein
MNASALDAMASALAAGDSGPLIAALAALDMSTPDVLWNPTPADLTDRRLRDLLAYWEGLRPPGGLPGLADIDPVAMGDAVGYVMLLEALPEGDFRYRLYGSRIAERSGFDMTGRRTSEVLPAKPAIPLFFGAVYRAATLRRAPVHTRHVPPSQIQVVDWRRLILPLAGPSGRVDFLVGNIPGEPRPIG